MAKILLSITAMRFGGAERVISTIANELTEQGHDVTLLSFQNTDSLYDLNEKVEYIKSNLVINRSSKIRYFLSLLRGGVGGYIFYKEKMNEIKPTVVLSFLENATFIASIYKIFNRSHKLVISERNDITSNSFIMKKMKKFFYKNVDGIVCQSKIVASFYNKKLKIPSDKIKVIGNPLNPDSYFKGDVSQIEREKKILAVGRLCDQKNFQLAIDSFKIVHQRFPDYRLKIIGEGDLRNSLEYQINNLGLDHAIEMNGEESFPFIKNVNPSLFIVTSKYEGFPNVLIEAMATGLPIITTNFSPGVAKEIVKSKTNGIIVNSFDPKDFADAMIMELLDEELRRQQSLNNLYVRIVFSQKEIMKNWESFLLN